MEASLSAILGGSQAQPAAPAAAAPSETAAPVATTETSGETVETSTAATTAASTPEPTESHEEGHQVPYTALREERRKRQEAERLAAELKGKVEVYSQVAPAKPAEPPENPDDAFYRSPSAAVQQALQAERERSITERINMSEVLVREQHPDYDDVIQGFHEAVQRAPHLVAQMRQHPLPAKFAYDTAKTYREAAQYGGSITEMKAKIREQLKTEIREELKREAAEQAAQAVQPSLVGARGTGTSPMPQWQGPRPLKQLFGR